MPGPPALRPSGPPALRPSGPPALRPSGAFGDEGVSIGYRYAPHIIADFVERREFPSWKESIAARIAAASDGEKSSVIGL
jgi:hypothetical protein